MTKIPIDVAGRIVAGFEQEMYVKVLEGSGDTSGFYILTCEDADFEKCFDGWVADERELERYFGESGWLVEWTA